MAARVLIRLPECQTSGPSSALAAIWGRRNIARAARDVRLQDDHIRIARRCSILNTVLISNRECPN
jgi:hypothetical protein